jgi:outer membrane receptor protein involved in Fe transport
MRNRAISLLLASSALTVVSAAHAQDTTSAPAPQDTSQPAANETDTTGNAGIVVTGTRIVRDGYTAPTPVTVATAEDLVKATPTNLPDALNKLPQFQNSLSPGRSANNFSAIPIHGNILNLRGLGTPTANPKGPLRTLIMLDGIRVAPTTYIGTIDTNVIPNLLVQRVDVVTGGASAAWGSDAVAGVVNFVLDKKFTGIRGVAQAGISSRGDVPNQRIGLAYGTNFSSDRGHILLSGEYYNNGGLTRNQRAIGNGGYAFVGQTLNCVNPNVATDPSACTPGGSLNPLVIAPNIRLQAASEFGKIFAPGNPFNTFKVDANGALSPFNTGTPVGTPGEQIGGDGYTIPARTTAIAPFKTYQGFGRISYDVTDDINVYAQAIYSRQDLDYDALANSLVQASPTVTLFKGNPFIPAALDATIPGGGSIGYNAYWGSLQATRVKEQTDFWQATTGVEAHFGGWKATLDYTHGQSIHHMDQSGLWDWKRLNAAVDVVNVNGVPTCRVLTDPTVASQYTGCLPLNLFNGFPQQTQPAAYAWATGTSSYRAKFDHDSVTASLSGSLFELPAGPVDIVVGAEYRHQSLDLTSNADPALLDTTAERNAYFAGLRGVLSSELFYWLTNVGVAKGSLNVKEGFGEIAVPLLKDKPVFEELSLNGAVRVTDYSTSGTVTTWKVGGTWKPVTDFLLRATYSRDIRAPNLYELYRGDTSGLSILLDPVTGINQNIPQVSGGNPNLKPEVANTLTIGGVFSPRFLPGFSLSIDYYRIHLKGAIDALTGQQILNNCAIFGSSTPECSLITRPVANQPPTLVRITEANIAFINTAGIDFDASYRASLGSNSALAVRLYANYLDYFDTQAYAGQPVIHYAGANVVGSNPVSYPHWRGSLSLDYTHGNFGVNVNEQFIGSMNRFINAVAPTLSNFVNGSVGAVAYTDLSLRYRVPHNDGYLELFATINNLFDKDPPLIPGITPGVNLPTNISTYDIVGRAFTAGARFKF